jgi:hypothetical protein
MTMTGEPAGAGTGARPAGPAAGDGLSSGRDEADLTDLRACGRLPKPW